MSENGVKEIIYVDVEDDITSIIDKVKSTDKKIIALVLPKRSAALQSIVNMKLLKRTVQNSKKNVVLITKEQALLPLAGAAGMYVAPNLQSKPEIPQPPSERQEFQSGNEATEMPTTAMPTTEDTPGKESASEDKPTPPKKVDKPKKKPKIPNFEKFRLKLILGILAVLLLIGGWVMAAVVLPKATVTLATDTQDIDTNFSFTADTEAESLDLENKVVPAIRRDFRATDSEEVAASGKKNLGKEAEGEVTLSLANCDNGSVTVPEGTAVSSGGMNYIMQDDVTLESVEFGGECSNEEMPQFSSETVDVVAQRPGSNYNLDSGENFAVSGYSMVDGENEDEIDGGTDKVVKVVSQQDVDKALNAIQARAGDDAPDDLKEELEEDGYYPLSSTLQSDKPVITTSPNVGDQANNVTVTATTSYTMDGVKEQQLRNLIDNEAKKKIDDNEQDLQEYSLNDATITLRESSDSETRLPLSLAIQLVAGPELDKEQIKEEVAGKDTAQVKDIFEGREGINEVEVDYSPFWVKKVPSNTSKVEINIENASGDDE